MKMICFDMDGTIADLYAVPNWLDKLRAEDASPYADAPAVLIDDNKKVRDGWHLGESIDPTKVNLLEVLSALD